MSKLGLDVLLGHSKTLQKDKAWELSLSYNPLQISEKDIYQTFI